MAKWPSDKELEEIYRKGSEKHDFSYDAATWSEMERMLDKDRRRKFLFIFFAGLLLLTAAIFSINKYNSSSSNIETHSEAELKMRDQAFSNSIESKNETPSSDSGTTQSPESSSEQTITADSRIIEKLTPNSIEADKNKNLESTTHSNYKVISDNQSSLSDQSTFDLQVKNTNEVFITAKETAAENQLEKSISTIVTEEPVESNLPIIYINQLPILIPTAFANAADHEVIDNSKLTIVEKDDHSFSKLRLWGNGALESSRTPNGDFGSLDFSLGVSLSYQTSDKLSVAFGINYINDVYKAMHGDYSAKHGYWPNGEEPMYTVADCQMLEFSYGLKYSFRGTNQRGITIGACILSNIMLSEKYYYHFEEEINNFSSNWAMGSTTWLNAINLQPLYQFGYGKRGVIEIGPYFNIPIQGIGHGDVMLSSFGLRFSIAITK